MATSPSSRRAWIEMCKYRNHFCIESVALLAEGVDRNQPHRSLAQTAAQSPSSRRAWIEIRTHGSP